MSTIGSGLLRRGYGAVEIAGEACYLRPLGYLRSMANDTNDVRDLSPAAQRALDEAKVRREARESAKAAAEHNGPAGVEPTRFGDWERKGIAYDF